MTAGTGWRSVWVTQSNGARYYVDTSAVVLRAQSSSGLRASGLLRHGSTGNEQRRRESKTMGNLRYVTLGPERLRDTVEDRDFVTVRYMNEVIEKAARMVDAAMEPDTMQGVSGARIRALKEPV